jgi:hypothetical protein
MHGTSAVWRGSGFWRILIGFSLGQVDIADKTKPVPYGSRGGMPSYHALHLHKLSFVAEIAWSL